jgi:hypothetical protein
MEAMIE